MIWYDDNLFCPTIHFFSGEYNVPEEPDLSDAEFDELRIIMEEQAHKLYTADANKIKEKAITEAVREAERDES